MKALTYLLKGSVVTSIVLFAGSLSAMAQVTPPTQPAPRITNIVGTITAIDTQTGEESVSILPKAREGQQAPSIVIIPIDSATHIRMFGVPQADVLNLSIGYKVFVVQRIAIPASQDAAALPASTNISVDPKDAPVMSFENEPAP